MKFGPKKKQALWLWACTSFLFMEGNTSACRKPRYWKIVIWMMINEISSVREKYLQSAQFVRKSSLRIQHHLCCIISSSSGSRPFSHIQEKRKANFYLVLPFYVRKKGGLNFKCIMINSISNFWNFYFCRVFFQQITSDSLDMSWFWWSQLKKKKKRQNKPFLLLRGALTGYLQRKCKMQGMGKF